MKAAFNEADRYLIERWAEAREFELGMEHARKKYVGLLELTLAELREKDWWESDFKGWASGPFGIGFGRKSWDVTNHEHHFPGLWIDSIELDNLLSENEDRPKAYLWIGPLKAAGHNLDTVRRAILKRAAPILRHFPVRSRESENDVIAYMLPEERKEFTAALTQDRAKPFIDLLCRHADRLAGLIPAMDAALRRK